MIQMKILSIMSLGLVLFSCKGPDGTDGYSDDKRYETAWNSLRKHQMPQWLLDAKFGIYTHVTLQTINNMDGNENKHKHELIDDFKLENFNAAE